MKNSDGVNGKIVVILFLFVLGLFPIVGGPVGTEGEGALAKLFGVECECKPELDQIQNAFLVGSRDIAPVDIEIQTVAHIMRIPLNFLDTLLETSHRNVSLVDGVNLAALLPNFEPRSVENLSEFFSHRESKRVTVQFTSYCNYLDLGDKKTETCQPDKIVPDDVNSKGSVHGYQPRSERPDTVAYEIPGFISVGFQERRGNEPSGAINDEEGATNTDIYLQKNASGDMSALLSCARNTVKQQCTLTYNHLGIYRVKVGFDAEYKADTSMILQKSRDLLDSFIIASRAERSRNGNWIQPFPMSLEAERRLLDEITTIKADGHPDYGLN